MLATLARVGVPTTRTWDIGTLVHIMMLGFACDFVNSLYLVAFYSSLSLKWGFWLRCMPLQPPRMHYILRRLVHIE